MYLLYYGGKEMTDTRENTRGLTHFTTQLSAARLAVLHEQPKAALSAIVTAEEILETEVIPASIHWGNEDLQLLLKDHSELLMLRGQVLFLQEDYNGALALYSKAAFRSPTYHNNELKARNLLHTLRTLAAARAGIRARYRVYNEYNALDPKQGAIRAFFLAHFGYYAFWYEKQLMKPLQ